MPYAVDLFCGAGGFSEGILQAGFNIIFSSDKSKMVMDTYVHRHEQLGLVEGQDTHFELADVRDLTADKILSESNKLKYGNIFKRGNIDAFFGGPPCQGFSRLGKRDSSDPRNMLFHEYLRLIRDIRPKYVVMENVTGILDMYMLDFPSVLSDKKYKGQNLVKDILKKEIEGIGYTLLDVQVLNAANFGVPQRRNRVVFLAYRNDMAPLKYPEKNGKSATVYDAFGDLYSSKPYSTSYSKASINGRTPSAKTGKPIKSTHLTNTEISKHSQVIQQRFSLYQEGENKRKAVERLREEGINLLAKAPALFWNSLFSLNRAKVQNELRDLLTKHNVQNANKKVSHFAFTNSVLSNLAFLEYDNEELMIAAQVKKLASKFEISEEQTKKIWTELKNQLSLNKLRDNYNADLKKGKITDEIAEALFTKKGIRSRLDSQSVSPTMVTLPDDFINPYFNRVLTVREMARIQSFDDSFEFIGKRTTGGTKRKMEVPQFTQVGNAVPPLLAKAIATEVKTAINKN